MILAQRTFLTQEFAEKTIFQAQRKNGDMIGHV